jgi:hypothetical protein
MNDVDADENEMKRKLAVLREKRRLVKLSEFDERSLRKPNVYCIRPASENKSRII